MSDNFFENLKNSPLADETSSSGIEAIAIWLNMHAPKCNDLIKIFKTIEKHYHDHEDHLDDPQVNAFYKIFRNSIYGMNTLNPLQPFFMAPSFSDRALNWLFRVIDQTDAIDSIVCSKKFMSYVKDRRDHYRHSIQTMNMKKISDCAYMSSTDVWSGNLYEIFAELYDMLESKFTRTSQSLLS